nr:hypothetical protein Iba_chr14eCG7500 [Ipomoea batatas]
MVQLGQPEARRFTGGNSLVEMKKWVADDELHSDAQLRQAEYYEAEDHQLNSKLSETLVITHMNNTSNCLSPHWWRKRHGVDTSLCRWKGIGIQRFKLNWQQARHRSAKMRETLQATPAEHFTCASVRREMLYYPVDVREVDDRCTEIGLMWELVFLILRAETLFVGSRVPMTKARYFIWKLDDDRPE